MFRKLVLALGAAAVVGATALTPTAASAWGWHHHWHHGFGFGIYAPVYAGAAECYTVKRHFVRHDGSVGVRFVEVCD